jgi:hypothetical protein
MSSVLISLERRTHYVPFLYNTLPYSHWQEPKRNQRMGVPCFLSLSRARAGLEAVDGKFPPFPSSLRRLRFSPGATSTIHSTMA